MSSLSVGGVQSLIGVKRVRFVVSRVIMKKFSHAHTLGELVGSLD